MKLGLATGVLSSTPPPAPFLALLRVDGVWDRAEQPRFPTDEIPDTSYGSESGVALWEVTIDGTELTLVRAGQTLRGRESSNVFGERRFEITESSTQKGQSVFAGGRFVVRGEEAELTIFGSGVAVVSSERGKLISR